MRDGAAVIGSFATWEEASTYALEREREQKGGKAPGIPPTEPGQ